MASAGSDDGVTAFCRRSEFELRGKLAVVENLINDPTFVSSVGPPAQVCEDTEAFVTKASKWVSENKLATAGGVGAAGLMGVGLAFQAKDWSKGFQHSANLTQVNSTRADVLSRLNGGASLDSVKADLINNGNIRAEYLKTASADDVKAYLQGDGKASATMQKKVDDHCQTTAADRWAAVGAAVQMAISIALLGATIYQTYEIFKADGKYAKWNDELKELVAEKERLQHELKRFVPRFKELLGNGTGEDESTDGNILVWVEITALHNQVMALQARFNTLRQSVLEEKGQAAGMQWATGTAALSGVVGTSTAWVSAASKGGNPWLVAAAIMQSVGTAAAAGGCVISTITKRQLEKFERQLVEHIQEVNVLVEQYGKLTAVTESHYRRYAECKKEVISARDQALKDAKDREARMMAIMEDLKKGPSPEVLARLAALQAEMAAAGGA